MFSKSLLALAAIAIAVNAQSSSPSAPSGAPIPPPCVLACSVGAARTGVCNDPTNTTCVCQNAQFQVDVDSCVKNFCPNETAVASALQSAYCASFTLPPPTATLTPSTGFWSLVSLQTSTTPPSSGPSPTLTSPAAPSSTSSTSSSTGINHEAGVGAFFGAILAAIFAL